MRRKLLTAGMLAVAIGSFMMVDDPLRMITELLIAGIVPGLNISLGLFPSLLVTFGLLLLMRHWLRSIRLQMLRHSSNQTSSEKVKSEFTAKNSGEETKAKRNQLVIAPKLENN